MRTWQISRGDGPCFARSESRQRASAPLCRAGSVRPSGNTAGSWQEEVCGEATPYGFQYWLNRADWDADAVRDALRL